MVNKKSNVDKKKISKKLEVIYFGAGCFWGVEETFRTTPGVVSTEVGYAGGHVENATYEQVCTDTTGHAEVVKVNYDSAKISCLKLLEVFWSCHNPTQVNRQGPDFGTQYRSAIFYTTSSQKKDAEKSIQLERIKRKTPLATVIEKLEMYIPAEEYHQKYLMKRGKASCHI